MPDQLLSILLGTAGLTAAAFVALAIAAARGLPALTVPAISRWTLLGVLVHGGHFAEEAATGFHRQFPAMLGLTEWPLEFFLIFNLIWMAIWLACLPAMRRSPRLAAFPIWFLAIASTANGVVHPLLALLVGGYFPGLWTSPLAGLAGLGLLRQLLHPAHGRWPSPHRGRRRR